MWLIKIPYSLRKAPDNPICVLSPRPFYNRSNPFLKALNEGVLTVREKAGGVHFYIRIVIYEYCQYRAAGDEQTRTASARVRAWGGKQEMEGIYYWRTVS